VLFPPGYQPVVSPGRRVLNMTILLTKIIAFLFLLVFVVVLGFSISVVLRNDLEKRRNKHEFFNARDLGKSKRS
jgi:hypothetical protein